MMGARRLGMAMTACAMVAMLTVSLSRYQIAPKRIQYSRPSFRVGCQQSEAGSKARSIPSQDPKFIKAVENVLKDVGNRRNVENERRSKAMESARKRSFSSDNIDSEPDNIKSSIKGNDDSVDIVQQHLEVIKEKSPVIDERPVIPYLIVVEGKRDTAALKRAVNAKVLEIDGEGNSNKLSTFMKIRKEAKGTEGIMILTDPDRAGRNCRTNLDSEFSPCLHAFIPLHKATHNTSGNVGIENASIEDIRKALLFPRTSSKTRESLSRQELEGLGLVQGNGDHSGAGLVRQLTCEWLGLGPCDGKQLEKVLNRYGFDRLQIAEAVAQSRRAATQMGFLSGDPKDSFDYTISVNKKPFGMILNTESAYVKEVKGPAADAGIQSGDLVISIETDQETVRIKEELRKFLQVFRDAQPPFKLNFERKLSNEDI
mmetsp:Transcript_2335/g.3319  ORF Transcript_2335/g.3319 Transcript_2335/m.3319 type:complete len:428 (-) Transcript_2335:126-1409(-)